MKKLTLFLGVLGALLLIQAGFAFADKSAVSIDAPSTAQKGSEVTLRLTVTHSANSFIHYTQWLIVTVNQKEVARWEFMGSKKPEAAVFTREIKVNASEDLEITAEANCNLHGSKGPAVMKIKVQ